MRQPLSRIIWNSFLGDKYFQVFYEAMASPFVESSLETPDQLSTCAEPSFMWDWTCGNRVTAGTSKLYVFHWAISIQLLIWLVWSKWRMIHVLSYIFHRCLWHWGYSMASIIIIICTTQCRVFIRDAKSIMRFTLSPMLFNIYIRLQIEKICSWVLSVDAMQFYFLLIEQLEASFSALNQYLDGVF